MQFGFGAWQTVPQVPQLFLSVWTSTQLDEQHVGVPASQTVPHAPQLSLSEVVTAQYAVPASGWQSVEPVHAVPHAPVEQTSPLGQTFPHEPQFALSVCVVAQ